MVAMRDAGGRLLDRGLALYFPAPDSALQEAADAIGAAADFG